MTDLNQILKAVRSVDDRAIARIHSSQLAVAKTRRQVRGSEEVILQSRNRLTRAERLGVQAPSGGVPQTDLRTENDATATQESRAPGPTYHSLANH